MRNKLVLLFVFIASCGGDRKDENYIGVWKSGCITDAAIEYWVETTYEISGASFTQKVEVFDTSLCENGNFLPDTEGILYNSKSVTTTDGLQVVVYDATWTSNVSWESEIGFFVTEEAMYIVSQASNGGYSIDFDTPFIKEN